MAAYESRFVSGDESLPPVVKYLLIANILAFVAQMFLDRAGILREYFALWALGTPEVVLTPRGFLQVGDFYPWQLLTYGFLHGGFAHIFFNMFGLWMFGRAIEETMGSGRFLIYYLVCVVGAGLIQLLVMTLTHSLVPTVGASGGLFGILLAFGMMFPRVEVMLLFLPVPIEARYLVIGYGAIELINGISNPNTGVAHFAHLGGMLFGIVMILYWRGQLPLRPKWKVNW